MKTKIVTGFGYEPGTRLSFILRYKGRYYWDIYDNAFDLEVEGASMLLVDGAAVEEVNNKRSHPFMETDDGEQWEEWQYATVSITAAPTAKGLTNVTLSLVPQSTESAGQPITLGGFVDLLPVEVEELSPKLKNEAGVEIVDSENPIAMPKYNEMVETIELKDGYEQNRIAHREMKVKIPGGKIFAGKKVTWTMKAWGVKEAEPVLGDWKHSKVDDHKNRFEESQTYGTYGYSLVDQKSSETKIEAQGDDGYTAIRVNLPPFGWNHAEVKIKIEGTEGEMSIIRFVVPAIAVIDPGHGGTVSIPSSSPLGASSWNNGVGGSSIEEGATEIPSEVKEKELTQEYSEKLQTLLKASNKNDLPLRVYLTKTSSAINMGGYIRARVARDKGADLMFIIHFNASSNKSARGMVMIPRASNNANSEEDQKFSDRFRLRVAQALVAHDATARPVDQLRDDIVSSGKATNSDILGFYQDKDADYHPIRSAYIEVEFIHYKGGDALINGAATKDKVKLSVTEACRDAILEELTEFKIIK